jgi:hypothetical protein
MVMVTIAGFKNNGSSIEGEIFCLVALFPDGKIGNDGELVMPTLWLMERKRDTVKRAEAHGRTVQRTVFYGSDLVGHNSTHRSYAGTTCFKQITNVQGGTAETFGTRHDG